MIRHKICSILTLACLLLPIMPALAAPNVVQGTVDKLNIRSGPGLTYNVITQLSTKNSLHVLSEQDDWYQVTLPDGTKGWIASWLVKPVDGSSVGSSNNSSANSTSSASSSTVATSPTTTASSSVNTVVSAGSTANTTGASQAQGNSSHQSSIQSTVTQLNVRSAPNQTASVLQRINPDKSYPLLQKSGQWDKIQLSPTKTGWVAGWLVKEISSPVSVGTKSKVMPSDTTVYASPDRTAPSIGMIGKGDNITIEQEQAGWLKITYDGQPGWILSNPDASPANNPATPGSGGVSPPATTSQATVNATNVNLRSQPNTSSSVIGKLAKGDRLTILSSQGEWLQVRTPTQQMGWVAGWLVNQSASANENVPVPTQSGSAASGSASATPEATILNPDTNIRSGPGTTYSIVGRVQAGERFPILATEGEWFRIQLASGTIGYVAGWLVNADGTTNVIHGDSLKNKLIVVDAGHGGEDTGAIGTSFSTQEKVINLQVALDLQAKLEAAGATVIMTRSDDRRLTLQQRVDVAVNNHADLFVSVHHNTHPNQAMNGSIIFYYKEGPSSKLASLVQSEIVKSTNYTDLHSRFGDYFVLRENPVVAILCEVGFLSNYEEELRVRSSKQQDLAAEGIYKGIVRYFSSQSTP